MSNPEKSWQGGGLGSPGAEGPLAQHEDAFYDDPEPAEDETAKHHLDDPAFEDDPLPEEPRTTRLDHDDDPNDPLVGIRKLRRENATRASALGGGRGYPRPGLADDDQEQQETAVAPSGPLDAVVVALSRYWYVAVVLFLLVLGFLAFRLLSGGGAGGGPPGAQQTPPAQDAPTQGSPAAQGTPAQGDAANLPATDTGITLTEKKGDNGAYYISAGKIDGKPFAWGGKTNQDSPEGPTTTLEGPTALKETRSVELPDGGSETPGNFGRAEPGQPILDVTYQRTTTVDGHYYTDGEYHFTEKGRLILRGHFSDVVVKDNPKDEPDEIERTYRETPPASTAEKVYKVKFKAKSDAPVPALIGERAPAASGKAR